jgi:predicted phage terminase large subunit-like protein
MEKQPSSKICPTCNKGEPDVNFYRHAIECRSCITERARAETVEEQAAKHLRNKLLREELKKLAREQFTKKKRAKRAAAVKKLIPDAGANFSEMAAVDPVEQELARRELARRKLIEFVKQFHPRYKAGWVHHDICRRLEKFSADVEAGLSPRLMLLMPPRHGKSQLASKLYPAWHLGHYPHHEFIGCSYNISLALDFSREIRDVIRSDYYQKLFEKTRLNPDFMSAEAWRLLTSTGVGAGGYNAAGVGGGITGKGAHILVIDDPVKNNEEAESPDLRKKIWNWYQSTAYTRLAPGGGVLIIQTWWHDDDLAGRLQKEMLEDPEADQFEVIKYPAIAEEDEEFRLMGEALHPDRYDLPALEKIKRTLGTNYWSALYQQAPISEEGAFFKQEMFVHPVENPNPEHLYIYQAWDLAISEEQVRTGDFTVGACVGVDFDDNIHVLDIWRKRTNDTAEVEDAMLDMFGKYKTVHGFGVEDGQIWRSMKKGLKRRMQERRLYIPLDDKDNTLKPIASKMARARPLQGRMQNRKVIWPRGSSWLDTVQRELLRFPAGAHDDIVDALAWAVHLAVSKAPPARPVMKWAKPEKTVAEKLRTLTKAGVGVSHMAA